MISDVWYTEIESTILTYLQYVLVDAADAPFPDLQCTTTNQNISDIDIFPTLYIHLLPSVEVGNDLYNVDIPAINATFELQVFSDKSEVHCRKIIARCIQEMKKLHFNVPMFPDPQSNNRKFFAIVRCNRIIASGDADIVPKE